MSKFNINPIVELHPFKEALGQLFPKICNDTKAFIGREEAANDGKNVKATLSGVTMSAKCLLKSKEGYTLALPMGNPLSILLRFGMELSKLDNNMDNRVVDKETGDVTGGIQSKLPKSCVDWVNQQRAAIKQGTSEVVQKES